MTQFLFHQSVKIAERKFREMRPNVIVGSNYGAVVALSMNVPKVPMVSSKSGWLCCLDVGCYSMHACIYASMQSSRFGSILCVVSLQLLLTPASERFAKFMRLKEPFTLADCPYTIIVHGSNDKAVPLDDSVKLVETCEVGRCRLEVVGRPSRLFLRSSMVGQRSVAGEMG